MKDARPDRREFIKTSATTAAGLTVVAALPRNVLGANDRLRLGLVGCGGRGNYLLDEVAKSATELNVEIVALCDVWKVNREKTAAKITQRQGRAPKTFARYHDLISLPEVDAVLIATPDFAHTPILIEVTKLKKDAFVEKPLATVLDHAKEAMTLVHQQKTIVQVGTQRRTDRRHQAGAKLIQSGAIGKITAVSAAWHDAAPRWARAYDDCRQEDVDWEQFLMYLPKEPFNAARLRRWHFYKDFTSGTQTLLGSHLMDVGYWFMDDPLPVSAVAHGGVYIWKDGREHADTLDCALEYPKGWLLNYQTRLGNKATIPEVQFFGSKGTFDTQSWTARGEGGGDDSLKAPINVPKPAGPSTNAAPSSSGVSVPMEGNVGSSSGGGNNGLTQNDPRVEGEGHVRNWLTCVRSRATPNAPIEVGYSHTVAGIMCFKAWETGKRQYYDPVKRQINDVGRT